MIARTSLSMTDALARANALIEEIESPRGRHNKALIVAGWLKRMHDGGRMSMLRTVAQELGMKTVEDVKSRNRGAER